MYLNEPSLFDIVKKQFRFKLNAHVNAFLTFLVLQIGALFLSLRNYSSTVDFPSNIEISFINVSNEMNIMLAFLWAFFLGTMLPSVIRRNEVFSFITTRQSNHFANLLFMVSTSVFAGIFIALTGPASKLLSILFYKEVTFATPGIVEAPIDFSLRIVTAIAYILLFFLVGYTVSSLIQLNKLFIIGFVILFFISTTSTTNWDGGQYLVALYSFFVTEQSILYFILKIIGTVLGLFAFSASVTNRLEVRK